MKRFLIFAWLMAAVCAQGQLWPNIPRRAAFMQLVSAVPSTTIPPTNQFSFAQGNPIVNSSTYLPENFVRDPVSGLYAMYATSGSAVGLWTNGVDPTAPASWGLVSNVTIDASQTPSPTLMYYSNYWYLFVCGAGAATINVASNSTFYGPFTNSKVLISTAAGWTASRVCENYVFQRPDLSWVMLYMGDSGAGGHVSEQVGYATASVLTGPYTAYSGNPLIPFGTTYDAGTVADPWCINLNNTYYIGYAAGTNFNPPWYTAVASTTDFTNITRIGLVLNTNTAPNTGTTNAFRGAVYPSLFGRKWITLVADDNYQMSVVGAPADTLAPTISSITPYGYLTNSIVQFTTDIPANCGVAFGTVSGTYTATNYEVTSYFPGTWGQHSVAFTSTAGTTYYCRLLATNTAIGGQVALSAEQVVVGNSWNPTNQPAAIAVYDPQRMGLSAGTTITSLTDYTADAYHAKAAGSPWMTNNALDINNQSYTRLNGTSQSYATNFTLVNQPVTIYALVRFLGSQPDGAPFLWDSAASANREAFYENSTPVMSEFAGNDSLGATFLPLRWVWVEAQYNGASSFVKTNNVTFISGNPGAQGLGGITIGANQAITHFGKLDVAFMAILATNQQSSVSTTWYGAWAVNRFGSGIQ